MPYLPILNSKQLVKLLKKIGFVEQRQKGSHLSLYNFETQIAVTVPIHSKTVGKGLTHSILKQAGLTIKEVKKLLK